MAVERQRTVRMPDREIAAIKQAVADVFGAGARVRLFGSRADPARRGGDIDLLVETPPGRAEWADQAALQEALCRRVGDRKIDVLLMSEGAEPTTIQRIALRDGVLL